jgi:hypothetical protein
MAGQAWTTEDKVVASGALGGLIGILGGVANALLKAKQDKDNQGR